MAEGKERTTAIKAHGQHFAENIFSSPRKLIGQCKLFKHYYAPGAKVRPRTDVSIIWWHPSTQITKHNTPQHNRRGPKPLFLTWFVQNHYFSSVFGTFWPDLSQTIIFNTFLAHFGHFGGWYGNTHARKHTRTRTWDATKLKKTRPGGRNQLNVVRTSWLRITCGLMFTHNLSGAILKCTCYAVHPPHPQWITFPTPQNRLRKTALPPCCDLYVPKILGCIIKYHLPLCFITGLHLKTKETILWNKWVILYTRDKHATEGWNAVGMRYAYCIILRTRRQTDTQRHHPSTTTMRTSVGNKPVLTREPNCDQSEHRFDGQRGGSNMIRKRILTFVPCLRKRILTFVPWMRPRENFWWKNFTTLFETKCRICFLFRGKPGSSRSKLLKNMLIFGIWGTYFSA